VSTDDKYACAELIQSWGLFRDQKRWAELLATFTSDGTIAVSWFRGPFAKFVERCRTREAQVGHAKHLIQLSVVRVSGERALAETSVVILVRQAIEGIAIDLTSHARFLDRLVKKDRAWQLAERAAIYERDRLDPVEPSVAFAALIERADCARYPAPYRYMAYRISAAGGTLAMPVLCDGMAETDALRARYAKWLAEAVPSETVRG
jgi:SnoaL-like domain